LLHEILKEREALDLNTRHHPLSPLRVDLAEEGYITAKTLRCRQHGKLVKVAGSVILIHTPPTKSGIRVMFVTLEDETGLIDLTIFPKALEKYARLVLSSEILLVRGRISRMGTRDVSIVVDHIYSLKDFLSRHLTKSQSSPHHQLRTFLAS
jgi:error-prone DNA polymerase